MATTRLDLLDPAEVARLGGIEIVAQGVVEGFLAGLHRSPFRGFSVEFTEHRAYQPGDEPGTSTGRFWRDPIGCLSSNSRKRRTCAP